MNEAAMKKELHKLIDDADDRQIKEIYGLMLNYFNENEEGGWDSLSPYRQERITESIKQADAGLGRPFDEVTRELREKYGLNGNSKL